MHSLFLPRSAAAEPGRCASALASSLAFFAAVSCSDAASGASEGGNVGASALKAAPGWVTYGFDARNSQTNSNETLLDRSNVPKLKERWRLHVPDGASSTPAVSDGSAYFGSWDGRVFAVDADTGELRWQQRVTQGQVNSTPLVLDDRVYVTGGASVIALARVDGSKIYETVLDTHETAMLWSSPKLVDGMLVVGVASFENGVSLQPTFTGSVVALAADSGSELWRVPTTGMTGFGRCTGGPGGAVWSSAAFDEDLGLAFIGTGQGYAEPVGNCADSLLAIDYRRGTTGERVRWIAQYSQDDVFGIVNLFTGRDADVGAAPNLFEVGGRKLVGAGDKGGSYRAFDRVTGALVWRTDLDMGLFPSFGGVVTTAAVDRDTIYVASNHIDNTQFLQGGEPAPGDVANLYALEAATGRPRWQVQLPAPIAGSFSLANGVLYHPTVNNLLFARDAASGAELWRAQLQASPGAAPSIVDGRVYISAGMSLSATTPTESGGFVSSFGLDAKPLETREAPVEQVQPLSESQCLAKLSAGSSASCNACLCACNATAAGNCGQCSSIGGCTVLFCGLTSGADLRDCMGTFCNAKLLPSYVFDRAIDLAPCMAQCALQCGFQ